MESKGNVRKAYISCVQLDYKLPIVLCVQTEGSHKSAYRYAFYTVSYWNQPT